MAIVKRSPPPTSPVDNSHRKEQQHDPPISPPQSNGAGGTGGAGRRFQHNPSFFFFFLEWQRRHLFMWLIAVTTLTFLFYNLSAPRFLLQSSSLSTVATRNKLTTDPLEQDVDFIIEAYQDIIHDKVNLQSAVWFRHVGVYRQESTVETRPTFDRRSTSSIQQLRTPSSLREAPVALPDDVVWDSESDIPLYFGRLIRACSADASRPEFIEQCFGFLESLIHKPRCTSRLDSRVTCDKNTPERTTAKAVINNHFAADTINVVILGGGPAGQFLANVLSQLQRKYVSEVAEIRVLVVENRIIQDGYKKEFSRDWITGFNKRVQANGIDSRIKKFLDVVYLQTASLQINAWEELLLLSNRDRGVKLLYGDISDYQHYLHDVPNLLFFDGTGHRMDTLDRGEGVDVATAPTIPHIDNWTPPTPFHLNMAERFWQYDTAALKRRGEALQVGFYDSPTGPITYPVYQDKPYDIFVLKVLNLPRSEEMDKELQTIARAGNKRLRDWWTGPYFGYPTDGYFRPDIKKRIGEPESYPGFATRTFFITLNTAQGLAMQDLMQKYSDHGEQEFPLSRIPAEAIESNSALEGDVADALRVAQRYHLLTIGQTGVGPVVSAFRMRPYMYTDPLIPNGFDLGRGRRVPMLRIGDSLSTGDPNAGNGMGSHIQTFRLLQCRLAGLKGGNCDFFPHNIDPSKETGMRTRARTD